MKVHVEIKYEHETKRTAPELEEAIREYLLDDFRCQGAELAEKSLRLTVREIVPSNSVVTKDVELQVSEQIELKEKL